MDVKIRLPKVIYLDDEESALDVFSAILRDLNADLYLYTDAKEALELIYRERFSVIFLDVSMPSIDGLTLARKIREKGENKQTPLIFLSAYYYKDERIEEGYNLGAVDFLPKPVSYSMLRSKVNTFIQLHEKTLQLEESNQSLIKSNKDLLTIQKRLADREQQLSLALSLAKMGTWIWDLSTDKFEWSESLFEIHGLKAENSYEPSKSAYLSEFVYEQDVSLISQIYRDAEEPTHEAFKFEYRIKTRKNKLKYLVAKGINIFNGENKPVKKIGTVHDITEQKYFENELKEQQQYLSMAINAANLVIYEFDLETKYFTFSNELKTVFGPDVKNTIAFSETREYLSESEWLKIKKYFDEIISGKANSCEFEYSILYHGKMLHFMNRGVVVDDYYFETKKVVGAFIDITNLRETEHELEDLNNSLLERIEKEVLKSQKQQQLIFQKSKLESLGELAAGIGHEINNPLSIINLSVDNALARIRYADQSPANEYVVKKLNRISENAFKISNIIKQIRVFSGDQKEDEQQLLSVNEVLSNVISLIDTQYKNNNILIETHFEEECKIKANTIKLEQIFFNLFANSKYAIKQKQKTHDNFTGKIEITIFKELDKLFIKFWDNGIGIKKEVIGNIFDPFYTTKDKENGTGLGLSIVYGITKELNGDIHISSDVNKYASFLFEFPAI